VSARLEKRVLDGDASSVGPRLTPQLLAVAVLSQRVRRGGCLRRLSATLYPTVVCAVPYRRVCPAELPRPCVLSWRAGGFHPGLSRFYQVGDDTAGTRCVAARRGLLVVGRCITRWLCFDVLQTCGITTRTRRGNERKLVSAGGSRC
jgi:hypothetical protein